MDIYGNEPSRSFFVPEIPGGLWTPHYHDYSASQAKVLLKHNLPFKYKKVLPAKLISFIQTRKHEESEDEKSEEEESEEKESEIEEKEEVLNSKWRKMLSGNTGKMREKGWTKIARSVMLRYLDVLNECISN